MSTKTDNPATPLEPVALPKLDAHPGPALWLSPQATEALAQATLKAHAAKQGARRARVWQLAAGFTLFFGLSAGVSAALLLRSPTKPEGARLSAPQFHPAPQPFETPPITENLTPEELVQEPARHTAPSKPKLRVHSAADVLAMANHLRSQGQWQQAAQAYGKAIALHPRSSEGYAALIAAAALYREKLKDPKRSLALYRRALASKPNGPLAQEARWGIAQAHRQLGQRQAEAEALRTFLQHHPDSVWAAQAQQRLRAPESK